jgi:acetolactate synthase-1/2/3 large subunit
MLGMHGARAANLAVQECDLLLCAGARFDDRATGKASSFAPRARIVHFDMDASEIGKVRSADVAVVGDLRPALRALSIPLDIRPWQSRCLARKRTLDEGARIGASLDARRFLRKLSEAAGARAIVTCDVGQHQMWVAQHWRVRRPELHLSSGGLGAMGYGLPAAIGAQVACPSAGVFVVSGDGSIMMNVHELATVARYKLPIKVVLFDNKALGMVRQWQELFFDRNYSEIDLSDNPDFVRVAEAFGIPAFRIEGAEEESSAIARLVSEPGPQLAHVVIHREANVWPIVPPGKSNAEMVEEHAR